nr:site-2 protease family protein [Anaerolineae bacterium]
MRDKRNAISLGRVIGIPISLDYSWFLIFALLTWSLATSYYPSQFNWHVAVYWLMGLLTSIFLFGSVLLHELGHAIAAKAFHIPVNRIRLLIFGGVAELGDDPPSAISELLVAIAGPVVSILVAVGSGLVWGFLLFTGLSGNAVMEPVLALAAYMGQINLMLALFNLIPGFPLDGGRIFRSVVWVFTRNLRRATEIAGAVGRVVALGFIGFGVWQVFSGNVSNGLWMGFIGLFLFRAIGGELTAQRIRDVLSGRTVADVMQDNIAVLPGDLPLLQLVNAHIMGSGQRIYAVKDGNNVVGFLTAANIRRIPSTEWGYATIFQAMTAFDPSVVLARETSLWTVLRSLETSGLPVLPVYDQGRFVGILRREDVLRLLQQLSTLDPLLARL